MKGKRTAYIVLAHFYHHCRNDCHQSFQGKEIILLFVSYYSIVSIFSQEDIGFSAGTPRTRSEIIKSDTRSCHAMQFILTG